MIKSTSVQTTIRIVFDLFIYPALLFCYLTLPRLYAIYWGSSWAEQVPPSYVTLNLNLVYALVSLHFIFKQINYQISKIVLFVAIQLILIVRVVEVELMRIYRISYSPAFFANLEIESYFVG